MRFAFKTLFACLLAGLIAGSGNSRQVTGVIRGTVYDPSGATVSAAAVTVTQLETGFARTATSGAQGDFTVVELPIGHYRVQAETKGFQKFVQEGITLDVKQTATVAIHLAIGVDARQIEVQADAPLIESTSTNLGKTVGIREIQDLPLNERHFTQLGLLQPGVAAITPGLQQAGGSLRDGQAYAVNGQRPESNNFLIDGADNFNNVDGGFVLEPPVDAVAEFRILTHTANAEFGHSTGSTTNIVTRAGTNAYHGSLWEFLRNDAFDAKSFFAQSVRTGYVYSSVGEISGIANSTYHAMQSSLRKRFSHGFSMLGSYTFSKTLDDVSSFNITGSASQSTTGENDLAQNPFDLSAERGRSLFDARHRFVISYEWDIPFLSHSQEWYGKVLGGWQVNGITTFQTGTPFTVYDSA